MITETDKRCEIDQVVYDTLRRHHAVGSVPGEAMLRLDNALRRLGLVHGLEAAEDDEGVVRVYVVIDAPTHNDNGEAIR